MPKPYPWIEQFASNIRQFIPEFKGRETHYLEVGVFLGATSQWVLDNILVHPNSTLEGIDPWEYKHSPEVMFPRNEEGKAKWDAAMEYLQQMTRAYRTGDGFSKVTWYKGASQNILPDMDRKGFFDIAYIDGDHATFSVLRDFVYIWPMVKIGGIIVFDDYGSRLTDTKVAVDTIVKSMRYSKSESRVRGTVLFQNYQVGLRKHQN